MRILYDLCKNVFDKLFHYILPFLFFSISSKKTLDAKKKIIKQTITKLFTNQRAVEQLSSQKLAGFQSRAKLVLPPSSVVVLVAR